ncbi:Sterol desaturase/sphingolipid hydroxylase, fatty acid hydroxylase superfamily [Flaviramulus basaltis]|uniref:Sterol desaturase/sphingolipid hydroxylase, fatty acid hydroxylase superfamily n=1 Tax=Flaviramulus basaltis TaxID=369401 RepID=A0A1K2IKD3_9FLAO|nr:sterol desaturase family protein [Flaviramulus basaltis]SFZ92688.1 Sterol desaturase/sphingolipid hydroxylase, fatty acid hydroxylase superfamily [Flaviramulus basaltis]
MEAILNYFENIPPLHRAIIIIGGLTLFWIIEGIAPLFGGKYKKLNHAVPNIFFTITTVLVNLPLAFLFLKSSDWVMANNFGILNWLPGIPLWLYTILGILLIDFIGAYLPHLIEHKVKPLWKVHLVHHSDHNVDTTTANRHHPIESIIRYVFTLAGIFIIGTPIALVFLYQSLSIVATQFNHANIKLPKKFDKILSYVIVSPDMHKVHHHYKLPFTDSNYGNIFSIWDRLLGTYMELDTDKIIYGVDVFPDEKENGEIWSLLKQPFQKYKNQP